MFFSPIRDVLLLILSWISISDQQSMYGSTCVERGIGWREVSSHGLLDGRRERHGTSPFEKPVQAG